MSRLEHYMTFMKLPPELQLRITNYYQARYGGKWFDEKYVMDTISSSLKEVQLRTENFSLIYFCQISFYTAEIEMAKNIKIHIFHIII